MKAELPDMDALIEDAEEVRSGYKAVGARISIDKLCRQNDHQTDRRKRRPSRLKRVDPSLRRGVVGRRRKGMERGDSLA